MDKKKNSTTCNKETSMTSMKEELKALIDNLSDEKMLKNLYDLDNEYLKYYGFDCE